ncbi:hypothetical protein MRB53_040906 [Persea americana]|nr:hypothetical protein MRB53_040906 [Persea americana]
MLIVATIILLFDCTTAARILVTSCFSTDGCCQKHKRETSPIRLEVSTLSTYQSDYAHFPTSSVETDIEFKCIYTQALEPKKISTLDTFIMRCDAGLSLQRALIESRSTRTVKDSRTSRHQGRLKFRTKGVCKVVANPNEPTSVALSEKWEVMFNPVVRPTTLVLLTYELAVIDWLNARQRDEVIEALRHKQRQPQLESGILAELSTFEDHVTPVFLDERLLSEVQEAITRLDPSLMLHLSPVSADDSAQPVEQAHPLCKGIDVSELS